MRSTHTNARHFPQTRNREHPLCRYTSPALADNITPLRNGTLVKQRLAGHAAQACVYPVQPLLPTPHRPPRRDLHMSRHRTRNHTTSRKSRGCLPTLLRIQAQQAVTMASRQRPRPVIRRNTAPLESPPCHLTLTHRRYIAPALCSVRLQCTPDYY